MRAFVKRFTTATLESPDASDDLIMSAFIQGLRECELHTLLTKKAPRNFDELPQRSAKYINLEEIVRMKKGEVPTKVVEKPREA